ncbi:hypothetical protein CC80DRAFT_550640 [Byssothecium circinans]|uniref:Feruloyl esterase C n=1 Tax=Byssothecium circinans TaxID=147558 RepID=A0A6A5TR87_9PLEO|nr:hypothetical protein CC80DRAFT_550640 [Byssothecium circinans]
MATTPVDGKEIAQEGPGDVAKRDRTRRPAKYSLYFGIYIVPEGLDEGGYQGWANKNGQDVDFTDAMITTLQNGLCIDQNLIFSLGHSYGAGMSYALACARPKIFRAVAINSGANISGCSGGTSPVAMYIQHSVGDSTLPISAGRAIRDQFVKNNGCTP